MAKISVIVPVYKVEPYLRRCVDSILAQTFCDFELILVDDGSPDRCGEICDEYAKKDSRVVVIHQKNGGLSAARNAGIEWALANSKSEFLAFVDSDDWVHRDFLRVLYEGMALESVDVSVCGFVRGEDDVGHRMKHGTGKIDWRVCSYEEFIRVCWEWKEIGGWVNNVAWDKLYRKSLFATIRYPVGKLHEDVFTTYKVMSMGRGVAVCKDPLYFYFVNPESITGSEWNPRRLDAVYGDREQIQYFDKQGFSVALELTLRWYFGRLVSAIGIVRKRSDCEDHRVRIERMLREDFCCYGKRFPFPIGQYPALYKMVMPLRFRVVWPFIRVRQLGVGMFLRKAVRKLLLW